MKKQHFYLILSLFFALAGVGLFAIGILVVREPNALLAICMAAMVGCFAAMWWAAYRGSIAMWDEPKLKPKNDSEQSQNPAARSDNGYPDKYATREWVENYVSKQLVNSPQEKHILALIDREMGMTKAIVNDMKREKEEAYKAKMKAKGLRIASGFNDEGRFYWKDEQNAYWHCPFHSDGNFDERPAGLEASTKEEYDAHWGNFNAWWESHSSYGFLFDTWVPITEPAKS